MKQYKFLAFSEPKDDNIPEHNMLDFFRSFNAVELKYSPLYNSNFYHTPQNLPASEEGITLSKNTYNKIKKFEEAYQSGNLTKQKYNYIEENLQLVYGHEKVVHNDVLNYHNVTKKIIHTYLSIPQLERMFDEDYFNFEWDMHVGQNFKEHRNDYNRDHFVHQIRNLYMMLILLDKFDFYNASAELLLDESCGKISQYTKNKLAQFQNDKHTPLYNHLKDIQPDVQASIHSYFDKNKKKDEGKNKKTADAIENQCFDEEKYIKYYFLSYVIYGSTMLSALFHDMGYPICHFLETRHRVSEYNPTMYMFTHNSTDTFDQLASILTDSLLFTIVSADEIKENLKIGKNGRYNHGVYSAIAFLLQFYNNGAIYSLSPEKQCAIELAAVAIYDHTADFNCISKKESNNYYQQVFRQNPISFLLRFCDDLQEWDRRYFEFSEDSDLSVCEKCYTPFIPTYDKKNELTHFLCMCKDYNTFRYDSFLKRKLYVVRVSKNVEFKETNTDTNRLLQVTVAYDPYKLLKMARINNTYAKFRLGDLNKLKLLIGNQNFAFQSNGTLDFKYIYLDYFISANPLLIKLKILEKYFALTKQNNFITRENYKNIDTLNLNTTFKKIFETKDTKKELYRFLDTSYNNNYSVFQFYKKMLKAALSYKFKNKNINSISKSAEKLMNKCGYNQEDKLYTTALKVLIEDCFYQYAKEPTSDEINSGAFITNKDLFENYCSRYAPDKKSADLFYQSVGIFCKNSNYFNNYKDQPSPAKGSPYLVNYYTDLHFFYKMNEYNKEQQKKTAG